MNLFFEKLCLLSADYIEWFEEWYDGSWKLIWKLDWLGVGRPVNRIETLTGIETDDGVRYQTDERFNLCHQILIVGSITDRSTVPCLAMFQGLRIEYTKRCGWVKWTTLSGAAYHDESKPSMMIRNYLNCFAWRPIRLTWETITKRQKLLTKPRKLPRWRMVTWCSLDNPHRPYKMKCD